MKKTKVYISSSLAGGKFTPAELIKVLGHEDKFEYHYNLNNTRDGDASLGECDILLIIPPPQSQLELERCTLGRGQYDQLSGFDKERVIVMNKYSDISIIWGQTVLDFHKIDEDWKTRYGIVNLEYFPSCLSASNTLLKMNEGIKEVKKEEKPLPLAGKNVYLSTSSYAITFPNVKFMREAIIDNGASITGGDDANMIILVPTIIEDNGETWISQAQYMRRKAMSSAPAYVVRQLDESDMKLTRVRTTIDYDNEGAKGLLLVLAESDNIMIPLGGKKLLVDVETCKDETTVVFNTGAISARIGDLEKFIDTMRTCSETHPGMEGPSLGASYLYLKGRI